MAAILQTTFLIDFPDWKLCISTQVSIKLIPKGGIDSVKGVRDGGIDNK